MCQFPYDINGWDMYFCRQQGTTSKYRCPTASLNNQLCADGKRLLKIYAFIFDLL